MQVRIIPIFEFSLRQSGSHCNEGFGGMQLKQIKFVLTANLILFFWWAGGAHASEINLYGYPTQSTPYDHKNALTEVLRGPYPQTVYSPVESVDRLFWKAKRFSYNEEKKGDDWQFPRETEKKQAGDCEDKALWLYARLREAGHKNLILAVGKHRSLDKGYHMWLMRVDEDGSVLILDPTIQNRIWPLTAFEPGLYQPLFLFDGTQRYRCF